MKKYNKKVILKITFHPTIIFYYIKYFLINKFLFYFICKKIIEKNKLKKMIKCCCCCRKDNNNLNIIDSKLNLISTSSKSTIIKKENHELFKIIFDNNNNNAVKILNKESNNSRIPTNINDKNNRNNSSSQLKNMNNITFARKISSRNNINQLKLLDNKFYTQSPCGILKFSYFDDNGFINEDKKNNKKQISKKNKTNSIKSIPKINHEKQITFNLEEMKNYSKSNNKSNLKKLNTTQKSENEEDEKTVIRNRGSFLETGFLSLNSCKLNKASKLEPPPQTLNKFKHRQSVMNYETFHLNKIGNVKKSCSMMGLFEKNENKIEKKLLTFLSKNFRFLNRENLMQMTYMKNLKIIANESYYVDNEGKGEINLYLENYKGKLLLNNLIIGPLGLIKYSRRNAKDTITFFGYSEIKDYNDYVLNNTSFIYNSKTFTKTLFAFSYDFNCKKYFIQPILDNNKFGRFILINISNKNFSFINTKVIMLNKTIIQIIPTNNESHHYFVFNLIFKVFEENEEKATEIVLNNIENGQEISIGYDDNNRIKLKQNDNIKKDSYCKIIFDKEREIWSIKGNNVWLVLDQKFNVKDETLVKIGEDIIKVSIGA